MCCFLTRETIQSLVSQSCLSPSTTGQDISMGIRVSGFIVSCSPFPLDLLTVSEKAKEPPHDESGINAPTSLALEATYINHNFSQQMLIVNPTHITCI